MAQPSDQTIQAAVEAANRLLAERAASRTDSSEEEGYGVPWDTAGRFYDEQERLRALRSLGVVAKPSGPRFGAVTALLRSVFGVALAHVYLLEEDDVVEVPDAEGSAEWPSYP